MAGQRHHILPRFLLKGFASRTDGQKAFTWVYRKEGDPFEASTRDVGVEKHFYGKAGETDVDGRITAIETQYANLVDDLRTRKAGEVSHLPVAELVTHLWVRTKHLPDSLRLSSEFLFAAMWEYFSDFDNLKASLERHPDILSDLIDKWRKEYGIDGRRKKEFAYRMKPVLMLYLEEHREEAQIMLQQILAGVHDQLPNALKNGHLQALQKTVAPEPQVERYRELRWSVSEVEELLILGDCGCLFEIEGTRRFKAFSDSGDQLTNVFLPISTNRILAGTSLAQLIPHSAEFINHEVAKCSREFFVSAKSTANLKDLVPLLGVNTAIFTSNELEQMLIELKSGW